MNNTQIHSVMKMKKTTLLTTGITALSMLVSPGVMAQMEQGPEMERMPEREYETDQPHPYGIPAPESDQTTEDVSNLRPSSDIVGLDVKDPDGDTIGSVSEIYINVDSGKVIEVALSERSLFGRNDTDLIAFDKVRMNGENLEATVHKDEIKGSSTALTDVIESNGAKAGITDVVGLDVVDRYGETIGSIDEVYLDFDSGEVAGLVVTSGGMMGLGADKVAVSLDSIDYDVENGVVIAQFGQEWLRNAPEFQEDNLGVFRNLRSIL